MFNVKFKVGINYSHIDIQLKKINMDCLIFKMDILNHRLHIQKERIGSWNHIFCGFQDFKRSPRKTKKLYDTYKRSGIHACNSDKQKYCKFQKMLKIKLRRAQDEFKKSTFLTPYIPIWKRNDKDSSLILELLSVLPMHPRKLGSNVTVRPLAQLPVRPHHRHTNIK